MAVLGRQPRISLAELECLFDDVRPVAPDLASFRLLPSSPSFKAQDGSVIPDIRRLGGSLKLARPLSISPLDFLRSLPAEGKITLGVSDFSRGAKPFAAEREALQLKKALARAGRAVRVVPNKNSAVLSTATTLHNRLYTGRGVELIKHNQAFYRVIAVQNIDAYSARDQARPARDAKVGMLPPKLAQILINLCGNCPAGSVLLDPFCGTGVLLQEGALMGYSLQGSDLDARMIHYTRQNLRWLSEKQINHNRQNSLDNTREKQLKSGFQEAEKSERFKDNEGAKKSTVMAKAPSYTPIVAQNGEKVNSKNKRNGDLLNLASATEVQKLENWVQEGDARDFQWRQPIRLVACETYLGPPMSQPPAQIKLKEVKQECKGIILGFLRNLAAQIPLQTPVAIAVPAWLRPDQGYERLNILDDIRNLGYNVKSFKNLEQADLLYHRERQVVAREIIVLRKE